MRSISNARTSQAARDFIPGPIDDREDRMAGTSPAMGWLGLRRVLPNSHGSARRAGGRHVRHDFGFCTRLGLDIAGNLATAFDLDLAIPNRPGDAPAGFDQEPLAHHEIAL